MNRRHLQVLIEDNFVTLTATCRECGFVQTTKVWGDQYVRWQQGAKIQDCFRGLDADQREIIMSGLCGTCFDKLFGD